MKIEEMEKRWPELPPNKVIKIILLGEDLDLGSQDIDQDTIEDVIEYFQAAKEAMNG